MPWLPIYAAEDDYDAIKSRLNADEEVAFLISDGPGRWRAVETVASLKPGRQCIWHVSSGPLPLLRAGSIDATIPEPFAGWNELYAGADPTTPYFGAGHPGIVWLNLSAVTLKGDPPRPTVGMSSFEWIGNRYRSLGAGAAPNAEKWWRRLGTWLKANSMQVPRGGPNVEGEQEIFAMKSAFDKFKAGAAGAVNP